MSFTPQVFDVHRTPTFDESIQRLEQRTYYPFVKSFLNNDIVEITINQGDAWLLMFDAALYIKGKMTQTAGTGECSFANNGGAFLFDSISYELNGKELETVRNPGIVSAIRTYLCHSPNDEKFLITAGWAGPTNKLKTNFNGTFNLRIPLKYLFGIFNDYQLATCGKQTIRLIRARNDNNALFLEPSGDGAANFAVEISISDIVLKVKHIQPSDFIRLDLLQSIKADRPIIIPYRKWELHELPNLTHGAKREIWPVKTSTAVASPRYVIVGFQTNRNENSQKDPSQFDHINISDVRLILNGEYFPFERLRLDFQYNEYVEAYHNYVDFGPSYMNEKHPLLDFKDFKDNAPLFVIDCSRRSESMKSSTVDVKLDIESIVGFPASTRAYCIIIHDCTVEYLPLSEIVRDLM